MYDTASSSASAIQGAYAALGASTGNQLRDTTTMEALADRTGARVNDLASLNMRLSQILDRGFGPRPEPGSAEKPREVPNGVFAAVGQSLDMRDKIMGEICQKVTMIESAI